MKVGNRSSESMAQFRCLGTTQFDSGGGKRGLDSFNAVQNLLSSHLLSENIKIRIYRTIILPEVLYGCETLSLTLRKNHRLRVFENRVLRRIFGSKRDEVTAGWKKLHNEGFHNLYSSSSISRMIESRIIIQAGPVAGIG
jgi:hypothetical protein